MSNTAIYEKYPGYDGQDGLPVFSHPQQGAAVYGPCPLCAPEVCRFLLWGYAEMPGEGTLMRER